MNPVPIKIEDLTGRKFNRLTCVQFVRFRYFPSGKRQPIWQWLCDCGNLTESYANLVKRGHTQSCGCYGEERRSESHTTHGHYKNPEGKPSRIRSIYNGMVQRCTDLNSVSYQYYGAKGIRVLWNSFEEFLADMEPTYGPTLTIERNDNAGHYCKENCRWATTFEQTRNYSRNVWLEHDGKRLVLKDWEPETGIKWQTIRMRLKLGWSVSRALTERVHGQIF